MDNSTVSTGDEQIQSPTPPEPEALSPFAQGYVTYGLIAANVLVYVVMVLNGVHFMQPTSQSLVEWGADYGPLTFNGQWWRMLSSCFVHIGLIHLLFNMYAFFQVGLMLEILLGRTRLIIAYVLCGLGGSILSLYVHPETVSAGASGAIFGLYGVFLALLLGKYIHESVRGQLLQSVMLFVGYNLFLGLRGGVDNAAHIGGLLTGLLLGFTILYGLLRPHLKWSAVLSLVIPAIVVLVCGLPLAERKAFDPIAYDQEMAFFSEMESEALESMKIMDQPVSDDSLQLSLRHGLQLWAEMDSLLSSQDSTLLPDRLKDSHRNLQRYVALRQKSYTLLLQLKGGGEDTSREAETAAELEACFRDIGEVLEVLNAEQ